jgi:hypothetical protein
MTDNLVASGAPDAPVSSAPTTTREVTKECGYTSTVTTLADATGCPIIERWAIHGMDNF